MDNTELLNIVSRKITNAIGVSDEERTLALNYYLCRPRGDELPGRSVVQSADVADMVHAVLAQVLPSFTGDRVCEFEADGQGDELQARLETEATNKVMMESSRGFVVFYEAIKDALLLKNGVIKAWVEEETQEQVNTYEGATPEQQANLLLPQKGADISGEASDSGYRVTSRRKRRRVKMSAVDPINFYVDDSTDSILLENCRGTYERMLKTRGELLEDGYSRARIDELNRTDGDVTSRSSQGVRQPQVVADWAGEQVQVWDCYVRVDKDGDGQQELLRVVCGLNAGLLEVSAGTSCYACGTAWLQPHQWKGLSLFDLLKGVQDVKTAGLRGFIDNQVVAVNGDVVLNSELCNVDDWLTSRPRGIKRVRGVPAEAVMYREATDVGPAAISLLTYMDKVRSERGGAALEMQSGEPGLMSSQIGAQNVADVLTNVELLSNMVAKTLAETLIRSTFMLVHRLLRTEASEPMSLRRADQWITVDPRTWRARDRVNIKAGLSPGERRRKAGNFEKIVAHQMTLLQAGMDGVLVNLPNIYSAMLDWAAASDVDAGEKYFTDPAGQLAMQAGQAKSQQGQQQQQLAMQAALIPMQVEQLKQQMAKYEADLDARVKLQIAALQAEVEEAKLIGGATADLQLAELQARTAASGDAERSNGSGES